MLKWNKEKNKFMCRSEWARAGARARAWQRTFSTLWTAQKHYSSQLYSELHIHIHIHIHTHDITSNYHVYIVDLASRYNHCIVTKYAITIECKVDNHSTKWIINVIASGGSIFLFLSHNATPSTFSVFDEKYACDHASVENKYSFFSFYIFCSFCK